MNALKQRNNETPKQRNNVSTIRRPGGKQNKLGRNDLCWCGSGKKYKKCHMESDNARNSATLRQMRRVHALR